MTIYENAKVPVCLLPETFADACEGEKLWFDPAALCDIAVTGNTITAVAPPGRLVGQWKRIDLKGRMVLPAFIDVHTHLDKTYTWNRAPNRSGNFQEAGECFHSDKAVWDEEDLYLRGDFSLKCAWGNGTAAMRTHLDASEQVSEMVFAVYNRLQTEWAGRITLQAVALTGIDFFTAQQGRKRAEKLVDMGADFLGTMPHMNPDLDRSLDRLMALVGDIGVGLDLHVDENNDPSNECLRKTAEAVFRNNFPNPVFCGHCSSLALQEPARQAETLNLVKSAGIKIITLPMCNLFLQDRKTKAPGAQGSATFTPMWRGITLYHEMLDSAIPIACASDNVRDGYFAYGDYDMFEVLVQSIRIGQLEPHLEHTPRLVTATPAEYMGLRQYGTIEPQKMAELVVFPARSFNELLSRPYVPRQLISGENFRQPEMPDFSELD